MGDLVIGGASLSVLIIIIIQALKRVGLASSGASLVALLLGLLVGFLYGLTTREVTIWQALVGGLLSGAAASGLYDSGKAIRSTSTE